MVYLEVVEQYFVELIQMRQINLNKQLFPVPMPNKSIPVNEYIVHAKVPEELAEAAPRAGTIDVEVHQPASTPGITCIWRLQHHRSSDLIFAVHDLMRGQ